MDSIEEYMESTEIRFEQESLWKDHGVTLRTDLLDELQRIVQERGANYVGIDCTVGFSSVKTTVGFVFDEDGLETQGEKSTMQYSLEDNLVNRIGWSNVEHEQTINARDGVNFTFSVRSSL
jgi:hypothetical protein